MHRDYDSFEGWDDLPIRLDLVMLTWRRMVKSELPWRTMPFDDLEGMLRPMLRELLNEARQPAGRDRCARVRAAARDHGAYRRRQEHTAENVAYEIEILGCAIEWVLRQAGYSVSLVDDVVVLLRAELREVADAAFVGFLARQASLP